MAAPGSTSYVAASSSQRDPPNPTKTHFDGGGSQGQSHSGRTLRILTLIDEHSRACLALKVTWRINSLDVIEALADAMCLHCIPKNIRCDNGPEMISKALRKWIAKAGCQIQYIARGSPWENGYGKSFNGRLKDECLTKSLLLA
ncbi:hypothetical protein CLBKND_01030 [Methylorubrum aminovorans]